MIVWEAALSTGVDEIDVQHKELIAAFNKLQAAIAEGRGYTETGEMLDFVQFYAEWHFGREENCMEAYRCPVAQQNKDAHAYFLSRFRELYDQYHLATTDAAFVQATLDELEQWIVNHILKVDTHLRQCAVDNIEPSSST